MKIKNYRSGFAHLFLVILGGILIVGVGLFIASGLGPNVLTSLVAPFPNPTTNSNLSNSGDDQLLVSTLTKELKQSSVARSATNLVSGDINARLKTVAKSRKDALLRLAKKSPQAFLSSVLTQTQRNSLPVDVQSDVEQAITTTGQLTVYHFDDFARKESHFEYSLKSNSLKYSLYPTTPIEMTSGAQVRVSGYQLGGVLVANTAGPSFSVISSGPPPDAIGDQKTLFLLINFSNSNSPPFTLAQAKDIIFNGQMQKFYAEASYGKESFSGDVYGWFTLPRACDGSGCITPWLGSDLETENLILNNKIDLSKYSRVVFLINSIQGGGGWSSVGRGLVTLSNGSQYTLSQSVILSMSTDSGNFLNFPFAFSPLDYVLAHELGHALGVMHANSWDCLVGQTVYGKDCVHWEYGNTFDVMGSSNASLHFNGFYKTLYGWLDSASTLNITQSGIYTLKPLEQTLGLRVAKIQPRDASSPYYVEYRQGVGFDGALAGTKNASLISNTQGLFVNLIDDSMYYPFPRLINMRPGAPNWDQVTLNGSTVYKDAGRGITIGPIKSSSPSEITFNVQIVDPVCVRDYPLGPSGQYLFVNTISGISQYFSLNVTNHDSVVCGSSDIELSTVVPPDWSASFQNPISNIQANQTIYNNLQIDIPSTAAPGTYVIEVKAKNKTSGLENIISKITVQIVGPATLIIVSPVGGEQWEIGSKQNINWKWAGDKSYFSILLLEVNPPGSKINITPVDGLTSAVNNYDITIPYKMTPGKYTVEMCSIAPNSVCASSNGAVMISLPTPIPIALPDWANKLTAVWNLDDVGSANRINSSTVCGANCNLKPYNYIINDSISQEGKFSNRFTSAISNRLSCTSASCPALNFPSSFTIGCWARPTTEATSLKLVSNTGFMSRGRFASNIYSKGYAMSRDSGWINGKAVNYLRCSGGDGVIKSERGFNSQSASNTFQTNSWTHVACRYDASNPDNSLWSLVAITNGKASTPTNVKIIQDKLDEFDLGAIYSTSSASYFNGQLDECFATTGALSDAALCRIARCGIKGEKCTCSSLDPKTYISTGRELNCSFATIPCNAVGPI